MLILLGGADEPTSAARDSNTKISSVAPPTLRSLDKLGGPIRILTLWGYLLLGALWGLLQSLAATPGMYSLFQHIVWQVSGATIIHNERSSAHSACTNTVPNCERWHHGA
jgi:hypothetical protein